MFTRAIVKTPGKSMVKGLTTANAGLPDHAKALEQHHAYIQALESCGLQVRTLPADENYPDSTFIEDVALLSNKCAIVTNPGVNSRQGETAAITPVLADYYANIESLESPGTLEAGDVMMTGSHFYIGLSERTNQAGARQLIEILQRYGKTGSMVEK